MSSLLRLMDRCLSESSESLAKENSSSSSVDCTIVNGSVVLCNTPENQLAGVLQIPAEPLNNNVVVGIVTIVQSTEDDDEFSLTKDNDDSFDHLSISRSDSDIFDTSFELFNSSIDSQLVSNRHELLRNSSPKNFEKIPIEISVVQDIVSHGSPIPSKPRVHKHLRDLLAIPITYDHADDLVSSLRGIIHAITNNITADFVSELAEFGLVENICRILSRLSSHAELVYTALRVVIDVVLNTSYYDARASFYNYGLLETLAVGFSKHIQAPMIVEMLAVCISTLGAGSSLWKTALVDNSICDMCIESLRIHFDNATVLERGMCSIGVMIDNSAVRVSSGSSSSRRSGSSKSDFKLRCSALGLCEVLLSSIDRFITDEALVLQGCVAISSICYNCVEIKGIKKILNRENNYKNCKLFVCYNRETWAVRGMLYCRSSTATIFIAENACQASCDYTC